MTAPIFMMLGRNANGVDSLLPTDQKGAALLARIKQNEIVTVEVRRPRSLKHLRLFWALMDKVWENLPERLGNVYPSQDNLVDAFKIATGHFEPLVNLDGEVIGQKPKSIAFHSMGQDKFNEFFETVITLVIAHFLPGVTKDELRQEIEEMLGMRRG